MNSVDSDAMVLRDAFFLREDSAAMWRGRDPFRAAQEQTGTVYRDKEGRRTLRFEYAGHGYFLKLHQGVGWKEIFKNLMQGRLPVLGAKNEYRAIRALEQLRIDTLSIAAYGQRGYNPATQLSFLLTDELQNVESLEDFCGRWPQQPPAFALKRKLIGRVAAIARTMHRSGINHRDFYLCHFLLQNSAPPITAENLDARKLYLMDLHRAQIRRRVPQRWLIKDLGGLYYSALDIGLTRRDIFRFMRAYTQRSLRELLRREGDFWTAVRARAHRIYVRDHCREPQSAAWLSQSPMLDAFLRGERHLATPSTCALIIDGKNKSLRIDSVLRLLPRKRLVVKARLDGQPVVIKLFVRSHSSKRHIERERAGYTRVSRAGIRSPQLLHTVATSCGRFEGVLYEFIDAPALSACWSQFTADTKRRWLLRITRMMSALHRSGAYQSDIHADNFLINDDELYLLDLGSIARSNAPLRRRQSIANLGALIAQFTFAEQKFFAPSLADYCEQRGWHDVADFNIELREAVKKNWQLRKRDYLHKALRECKLTAFTQSFKRVQALRRDWLGEDLTRFCADPNAFMAGGTLLKAGNTATVVKASINGKSVIIKRYNIKNWRHALSRSLRPTRAQHAWLYAHWLELAGIESMKPIALIEKRFGCWHRSAYFVGTWIDAPDLLSIGRQRQLTASELKHLQTLLEAMRAAHLSHGDFKANNLLLCENSIALIDLDALREHTSIITWRRAFKRDMARLLRNWPEHTDIAAQIKALIATIAPSLKKDNLPPNVRLH